jgi:hypothetical protein
VTEAATERRLGSRRPGVLATVAVTLSILGLGFAIFGYSPAIYVTLYVGMLATYVAIPYTAVAIIAREFSARRGQRRREGEPAYSDDAMQFRMFRQRASIVNAVAMLGALIAWPVLVSPWDSQQGSGTSPLPEMSVMTFGAFAVVAGVLAIVVNAPSIYSGLIARSERHAIRERVGAWKLILANTILTTASWIAYCGVAVFLSNEWM